MRRARTLRRLEGEPVPARQAEHLAPDDGRERLARRALEDQPGDDKARVGVLRLRGTRARPGRGGDELARAHPLARLLQDALPERVGRIAESGGVAEQVAHRGLAITAPFAIPAADRVVEPEAPQLREPKRERGRRDLGDAVKRQRRGRGHRPLRPEDRRARRAVPFPAVGEHERGRRARDAGVAYPLAQFGVQRTLEPRGEARNRRPLLPVRLLLAAAAAADQQRDAHGDRNKTGRHDRSSQVRGPAVHAVAAT